MREVGWQVDGVIGRRRREERKEGEKEKITRRKKCFLLLFFVKLRGENGDDMVAKHYCRIDHFDVIVAVAVVVAVAGIIVLVVIFPPFALRFNSSATSSITSNEISSDVQQWIGYVAQ